MKQLIPAILQNLWKSWGIRGMVLLSFLLQTILVVFGSRRKTSPRTWIRILLWSAYLSADWVATFSLSFLASKVPEETKDELQAFQLEAFKLQAFWAPFLLLHLGGQDNITAYSLEDNELWLRHFLGFIVQVVVALYVFLTFWSNNALTYLAIPVLVTGILKYGERILALRSSSTKNFKDSLLSPPDAGADLVAITTSSIMEDERMKARRAAMIVPPEAISPGDNYIVQAFYLFKRFKYLFADLILGYYERKGSYSLINGKSAGEAFNLVAVELGFLYDVLYTKATIVYSPKGLIFRCISLFSLASTLVAFAIIIGVHKYEIIDIAITYLLLAGSLVLEIYSLLKHIFSDWTTLWLIKLKRRPRPRVNLTRSATSYHSMVSKDIGKRWSGSIAQYNLINFCLEQGNPFNFVGFQRLFGIHEISEQYIHRTWVDIDADLQELIFLQLQEKVNQIEDESFDMKLCKQILAQRGDHALDKEGCLDDFRWSTVDVEFDHSLLLWHIATDLCYHDDIMVQQKNSNPDDSGTHYINSKRKISKHLSDYMLYLLVMCPKMLPKGIGEMRYRDTCAEALRFFKHKKKEISDDKNKACKELLEIDTKLLEEIKGDRSQSVLFYGCRLAKQLKSLESKKGGGHQQKWEIISEVWLELLTFAANRCEWKEHGQRLRNGGELLTHVSLLMTHFGLSEQYQIQKQYIKEVDFSSRDDLNIILQILVDTFAACMAVLYFGSCCCCLNCCEQEVRDYNRDDADDQGHA